ncbi:MAG TPA: hypothetical protein PLE42_01595 [Candidatus Competibacteraceae bacterium]|nr:hypothetical protein [Candidatus Competibacteraceae bacterium]HQC71393.1 hypothetical protein [Candidatus Competibacteraceae bacterium]
MAITPRWISAVLDIDPRPSRIDLSMFKRSLARCTAKGGTQPAWQEGEAVP